MQKNEQKQNKKEKQLKLLNPIRPCTNQIYQYKTGRAGRSASGQVYNEAFLIDRAICTLCLSL